MISRALIALGLILLIVDIADLTITGLAVLAAVLIGTGWLTNHWFATDEESAALPAADITQRAREGRPL